MIRRVEGYSTSSESGVNSSRVGSVLVGSLLMDRIYFILEVVDQVGKACTLQFCNFAIEWVSMMPADV